MAPKSEVWKFFKKRDKKLAQCTLCPKILKTSGNTSNLLGHIKSRHKEVFSKCFPQVKESPSIQSSRSSSSDLSLPTLPSTSTSGTSGMATPEPKIITQGSTSVQNTLSESIKFISSFKEGGEKFSKVTEAILYMICRDNQPISIVEDDGFRHLLKVTVPLYNIPSRKTIDVMIDTKYQYIKNIFKMEFTSVPYICLTTDIWTETHQTRSFLGVTAHFVSQPENKMLLDSVTLGVYELSETHTADNIAEKLLLTCSDWGLKSEMISAVITDGASNMTSAVEKAFDKKKHSFCFAHLLNLMAQNSIESLPEVVNVVDEVKAIVTWFKHSVVGSDELRKRTEHLEKKS